MELNLDRLNGLRFADFQEKQPSKTPTDELLGAEEYKTSAEQKHALKGQIEGLGALQRKADQNKAEIDRNLEVYRTYQENIKRSGQLQSEILKGIKAGEDVYSLFLKAAKAISLMTSNSVFYSQIEDDTRSIYGRGLNYKPPLQNELQDTQKRLQRLLEAEQREADTDSRERIKRAVKAHREHIAELEAMIARAEKTQL